MSKFQASKMKNLSMSYDTFLPGLADYCDAEEVMMFLKKDGKIIKSTYIKELTRVSAGTSEEYEYYSSVKRGEYLP